MVLPLPLPSFLPSYFALALCPLLFDIFFHFEFCSVEEEGMLRSSSISSDKILKENVCKIKSSPQAENGIREKKFLDVTLVGEDDLDFLLHGMTFVGSWNTVALLGLVKIQHQCSTMTWIQIRQIYPNFLLLVIYVV